MMEESTFRQEDKVGLLVAVVLHVLLAGVLALQMLFVPEPFNPPERVNVSLASEISLEATAPSPAEESRAAIAPTLTETPEAPAPEEIAEPRPEQPIARSQPRTERRPAPSTSAPERPRSRPDREAQPAVSSTSQGGGSRIGDNFLEGSGDSTSTDATEAPAPTFGRRERAALTSAITRQLRRHWSAPIGVDAERLVSTVTWQLNSDGSLKGRPRCRTQPASITPSNRPQAALHCERAIRAVQLAAPFNLPEQFYSRWDDLEWQFDRRL
ncbi:MAG: energy transducer TonB [Pseudomonadota bacterium]